MTISSGKPLKYSLGHCTIRSWLDSCTDQMLLPSLSQGEKDKIKLILLLNDEAHLEKHLILKCCLQIFRRTGLSCRAKTVRDGASIIK